MNLNCLSALLFIHRIDLVRRSLKSSPDTRAPYLARSAQFNLFPLLNKNLNSNPLRLKKSFFKGWKILAILSTSKHRLARRLLSHTVKELVSRGLKSRSGVLAAFNR
jgi:hypothetical protein